MGRQPTNREVREAKAHAAAFWLSSRTPVVIRKVVPPDLLAMVFAEMQRADVHCFLGGPPVPYRNKRAAEEAEGAPLRWRTFPDRWEGHKGPTHRPVAVVYKKKE